MNTCLDNRNILYHAFVFNTYEYLKHHRRQNYHNQLKICAYIHILSLINAIN